MTRILLVCALVATFQQPIGHSMDGLVMRYTVNYCHGWAEPIQVGEAVVNGRTGEQIGSSRTTNYPIPPAPGEPPQAPSPAPADPANYPG